MTSIIHSLTEKLDIYFKRADVYETFSIAEDEPEKILRFLLPKIKNKDVLDVGCGSAKYLRLLSSSARFITGIDAAKAQLDIARLKTKDLSPERESLIALP